MPYYFLARHMLFYFCFVVCDFDADLHLRKHRRTKIEARTYENGRAGGRSRPFWDNLHANASCF